jgi:hypothetical protein
MHINTGSFCLAADEGPFAPLICHDDYAIFYEIQLKANKKKNSI